MPTAKLITSEQVVRIGDIASVPLRSIIAAIAESLGITVEEAQKYLIADGGNFQTRLGLLLEKPLEGLIAGMIGRKHPAAEELEQYFKEVLKYSVNLTGVPFPEKEGMPAYMVGGLPITTAEIMGRITSHFNVGKYSWKTLEEGAMIRDVSQKRPQGMYVFAHTGSDEPDTQHRNKSFNDFTTEKLQCMDSSEYLLSSGFHMWKHEKWMDMVGWTRTSSLWSGGLLVHGGWYSDDSRLCLYYGDRVNCYPDSGPRELFLG